MNKEDKENENHYISINALINVKDNNNDFLDNKVNNFINQNNIDHKSKSKSIHFIIS